jgi:hypothetical protein
VKGFREPITFPVIDFESLPSKTIGAPASDVLLPPCARARQE